MLHVSRSWITQIQKGKAIFKSFLLQIHFKEETFYYTGRCPASTFHQVTTETIGCEIWMERFICWITLHWKWLFLWHFQKWPNERASFNVHAMETYVEYTKCTLFPLFWVEGRSQNSHEIHGKKTPDVCSNFARTFQNSILQNLTVDYHGCWRILSK